MIRAIVCILILFAICIPSLEAQISSSRSFQEEELKIKVSDQVSLSGTLVTPLNSNSRLLIILVSPPLRYDRNLSGKNNDNGMFSVLTDAFVRQGISVFRFDNRGINKSTGNNDSSTLYTHANDVQRVVTFFKE